MARAEERVRLVIDTNILFAAIINSKGDTARTLFRQELELFAPEFIKAELNKYRTMLLRKGKYEKAEALNAALEHLLRQITIIPKELYLDKLRTALEITPDPKDAEFIALALKLNCPLWTLDKALIDAPEIPTITTEELLKRLR